MTIVAFEEPGMGSATAELRALGLEFAETILEHCQKVLVDPEWYRNNQIYATFQNVRMYRAMIEDRFAIYAVEELEWGGLKISIMFAGRYGQVAQSGRWRWSGIDNDELCNGLLMARAHIHFS